MTTAKYYGAAQLPSGQAVPGIPVSVYLTGTTTLATLTQDNGDAIANPMETDSYGVFGFNAPVGYYDIFVTLGRDVVRAYTKVQVGNPAGSGVDSVNTRTGVVTLVGTDIPVFVASGGGHAPGAVPDPGASSGNTKFLREDGTWQIPAGGGGGVTSVTGTAPIASSGGATPAISLNDGGVTYAKMQDVSAASKLLGRGTSGGPVVREITLGTNLSMSGDTLNAAGGGGGSSLVYSPVNIDANSNLSNFTSSAGSNRVGMRFTPITAGDIISGFRFYWGSALAGSVVVEVHDESGTLLASSAALVIGAAAPDVYTGSLTVPYTILPGDIGKNFTISMYDSATVNSFTSSRAFASVSQGMYWRKEARYAAGNSFPSVDPGAGYHYPVEPTFS